MNAMVDQSKTWGPDWAAAMVKAQRKFPPISKSADVTVTPKQGREYTYSYAPFDLIIRKVQDVLGEFGLAVIQDEWIDACEMADADGKPCVGTVVTVMTTVIHESGQYREYRPLSHRVMDIRIHDLGGITSYLRRYSFLASLRLAPTDEDDDGKAEMERPQGKPVTVVSRPQGVTTNPRGNARANADFKKAGVYVTEIAKAAAFQDDKAIHQLWDEIKGDQDTSVVVWDDLQKKHGAEFVFVKATLKPTASTGEGRRS